VTQQLASKIIPEFMVANKQLK